MTADEVAECWLAVRAVIPEAARAEASLALLRAAKLGPNVFDDAVVLPQVALDAAWRLCSRCGWCADAWGTPDGYPEHIVICESCLP